MKIKFLFLACSIFLVGCGTDIKHTSTLVQAMNSVLRAGVGDVVLQLKTSKSLPNAWGNADIFGRTTPTGMVVIQYAGLENGNPAFYRSGSIIETNATTMNSSGFFLPNTNTTYLSGTSYSASGLGSYTGTATTTGSTYIPPKGSHAQQMQLATTKIVLDLNQDKHLLVEGKKISVITATSSMVEYIIAD